MKTGMLAAEAMFAALRGGGEPPPVLEDFERRVRESWVHRELHEARNFGPAQHKLGTFLGAAFAWFDLNIARAGCHSPCITRRQITPRSAEPGSARPSPIRSPMAC